MGVVAAGRHQHTATAHNGVIAKAGDGESDGASDGDREGDSDNDGADNRRGDGDGKLARPDTPLCADSSVRPCTVNCVGNQTLKNATNIAAMYYSAVACALPL